MNANALGWGAVDQLARHYANLQISRFAQWLVIAAVLAVAAVVWPVSDEVSSGIIQPASLAPAFITSQTQAEQLSASYTAWLQSAHGRVQRSDTADDALPDQF